MKKRIIKITIITTIIIIVLTILRSLFLWWWNGFTPLIGRKGIERRLDRVLTIEYEYVSSEKIENGDSGRAEMSYTYKDANGLEFTVKSYKKREGLYASTARLWWYNIVEGNYTQMFMAQYEDYISALFGERFMVMGRPVSAYAQINVYNYEQLVETANILAKIAAEVPPIQISSDYNTQYAISIYPLQAEVVFCYGDDYESDLVSFRLFSTVDSLPTLEEMEESLAHQIKLSSLEEYIDMDTLPQRVLDMANNED